MVVDVVELLVTGGWSELPEWKGQGECVVCVYCVERPSP